MRRVWSTSARSSVPISIPASDLRPACGRAIVNETICTAIATIPLILRAGERPKKSDPSCKKHVADGDGASAVAAAKYMPDVFRRGFRPWTFIVASLRGDDFPVDDVEALRLRRFSTRQKQPYRRHRRVFIGAAGSFYIVYRKIAAAQRRDDEIHGRKNS